MTNPRGMVEVDGRSDRLNEISLEKTMLTTSNLV